MRGSSKILGSETQGTGSNNIRKNVGCLWEPKKVWVDVERFLREKFLRILIGLKLYGR